MAEEGVVLLVPLRLFPQTLVAPVPLPDLGTTVAGRPLMPLPIFDTGAVGGICLGSLPGSGCLVESLLPGTGIHRIPSLSQTTVDRFSTV